MSTSNVYNKTFTINANWIRCLTKPDSDNAGSTTKFTQEINLTY